MRLPFLVAAALLGNATAVHAAGWSGRIGLEHQHFWNDPEYAGQYSDYGSAFIEPKYNAEWDNGKQQFNFSGFARLDPRDENRQHADIRELEYLLIGDRYELRAGIRKVFWGVTEAQHLVDVINQSDLVENPDGETKLGQPMLNLALIHDSGTLDLFLMPSFRERTFPGTDGRPRTRFVVDEDRVSYEADKKNRHVDAAVRWSMSANGFDVGLSYFYGTGRTPRLLPRLIAPGEMVLAPRYDLLHQFGVDATYVDGPVLWKLEAVAREELGTRYYASSAGFEYTVSGVFDSVADIGLLSEYLYDSRGQVATRTDIAPSEFTAPPSHLQNDLLIGMRLGFNDVQSSQILIGVIPDLDGRGLTYSIEAERRLGDTWKVNLEWRGYAGSIPANDVLYATRNDDYLKLWLSWYF
ncbi:MAG: hypothetical protein B7Z03_04785 [Hydrogenophilales bacterium 32-62-9]|nr:MAG: hypothetical protein B7Z03_04785 [Hydrogenophilales bacterium 32-62-9]